MIELKNITFSYERREQGGLRNINLTVKNGECILLCGRSGCGKTTITRLVNGLIPRFYDGELTGQVVIDGKNIADLTMYEISEKVGSVFQNRAHNFSILTVTAKLRLALKIKECQRRNCAKE